MKRSGIERSLSLTPSVRVNPSEIKSTLSTLGARPNKKLGQHFLIDEAALEAIVTAANLQPGDRVLEVGPGLGVLTQQLLERGAEVQAIEQDRTFIPYLQKRFPAASLNVVHGDAATLHWHELVGEGSWKFISNLPYSITSLALRKALWNPHPADKLVVLIQREVAERCIAKDGKTSLLSLMIGLASASSRIVRRVPAGAFFPPPKVESAVLEVVSLPLPERISQWGVEPEKIMEIAKVGFAHARKQLASNLVTPTRTKQQVGAVLREIGLDERCRAEDLSPAHWAALTRRLA